MIRPLESPVVVRSNEIPLHAARAVLGDDVPVWDENEDVVEMLLEAFLIGGEVHGTRNGQHRHDAHAGAMVGLGWVRYQHGGRGGEAVVGVDDVHVEGVDLVAYGVRGATAGISAGRGLGGYVALLG